MREIQICLHGKEKSGGSRCLKVHKRGGVMTNEQDIRRQVGKGKRRCGMDDSTGEKD